MAIDDNTTYGLTGAQVKELAGQVNSAKTQTGASAPTTATPADYVGQLFYDTTNDDLYCCSAITAQGTDPETYEYTWEAVGGGGGGIPTDATFWGASYNSGTNKVQGDIILGVGYGVKANSTNYKGLEISTGDVRLYSAGWNQGRLSVSQSQVAIYNASLLVHAGIIDMNNHRITKVTDPTAAQDAATKNYVDTQVGNIETILQTLNSGTGAA